MGLSLPPAMFTLLKTDTHTAARRGRMVRIVRRHDGMNC